MVVLDEENQKVLRLYKIKISKAPFFGIGHNSNIKNKYSVNMYLIS
jgi:hypothetical protein